MEGQRSRVQELRKVNKIGSCLLLCCLLHGCHIWSYICTAELVFTSRPTNTVAVMNRSLSLSCAAVEKDRQIRASVTWLRQPKGRVLAANATSLFFPRLRDQDLGDYTCRATLGSSTINTTVSVLKAYIEPVFYSQASQTVSSGEGVSFQCVSGDSLPLAQITWKKGRTSLSKEFQFQGRYGDRNSLKVSGTLLIPNVSKESQGEYVCVTHNSLLNVTVYSNPAILWVKVVQSRVLISEGPVNTTVAVGSSANLSCLVQGHPQPSVSWYRNKAPLNRSAEHSTTTHNGQILTFWEVSADDEGFYHCEGNNGNGSVSSLPAYLLPAVMDWKFVRQPNNVTARAGNPASLQCRAPYSRPAAEIRWFKDNNLLDTRANPRLTLKVDGDLIFTRVEARDAGMYFCSASNHHVGLTMASQRASLQVLFSPNVKVSPRLISVPLGSGALFRCQARGNPTPTVAWYKGNRVPVVQGGRIFLGFQNLTLYISPVIVRDGDIYACEARNIVGCSRQSVALNVTVAPVIVSFPRELTAVRGSSIDLTCTALGDGAITYSWYKDGQLIQSSNPKYQIRGHTTLLIAAVDFSDEGSYHCLVSNSLGTDERTSRLRVHDPQPNSQTDGGPITIPHYPATTSPSDKDYATSSSPDVLTTYMSILGSDGPGTDPQSLGFFAPSPLASSTTSPMVQEMGTTTIDPKHQTAFTSHSEPIELDRRDNSQLWWAISAPSLKTRRLISVTSVTEEPIDSQPSGPTVLEAKVWGSPFPGAPVEKEFPILASDGIKNITSPPTSTVKPSLPPAMTTIGSYPAPEIPLTMDSPSLTTPLSAESSTPMEPSPDMTRQQALSKGGTQCSNISCLLKLPSLPPLHATKPVFTQERVKLFPSNTTVRSLTHLNHSGSLISIASLLPEATIWNSNFTTSQTLQQSDGSRGNFLSKVTAKGKKPSPSFVLEKHDIPIVVGVTLSLAMIFITMGVYSLRQKTTENAETERRMMRGPRSSNQRRRRFEMHTYDNRAFEDEKPSEGADRGQEERQKAPPGAVPKHPSPNTITVMAEFALDGQSHGIFSISGEGRETSQKERTSTLQQESESAESVKSTSLPSPAEDKTGSSDTQSLCSLPRGNAPNTALPALAEINPSLKAAEASPWLNSGPCVAEEPLREGRPLLEESLWKGSEKLGASRFGPRSDVRDCGAVAQGQLSPTTGIVSRSLSDSGGKGIEVTSVAADVLACSPIPAVESLPAPVPKPKLALIPSASNQQPGLPVTNDTTAIVHTLSHRQSTG